MSTAAYGERIHRALEQLERAAKGFKEKSDGILSDASCLRLGIYWAMVDSGLFTPEQARAALSEIPNKGDKG